MPAEIPTVATYEIMNFQFTTDYVAAFYESGEFGTGVAELPLIAVGVARWQQLQLLPGETITESENQIVGLVLNHQTGQWDIVNESPKYIGMFRRGTDLAHVTVPQRIVDQVTGSQNCGKTVSREIIPELTARKARGNE